MSESEQALVQAHGSGEQRAQGKQVSVTRQALNPSLPPGTFRDNPSSFVKEIHHSFLNDSPSLCSEATGQGARGASRRSRVCGLRTALRTVALNQTEQIKTFILQSVQKRAALCVLGEGRECKSSSST